MLTGDIETSVSFEGLVAGRLVHRSHLSDVLVTDVRRLGQDEFQCGVQWPVNHAFWGRGATPDSAMVAETVRQVTTYIAHVMYGVELDQQFLMSRLEVALLANDHRLSPLRNVRVLARFRDIARNKSGLTRFSSHIEVWDQNRPVAAGAGFARLVSLATYARTRMVDADAISHHAPMPQHRIAAAEAGVLDAGLVVVCVGNGPGEYELAVPHDSPAFFDHPLDHVPGMALMEGIRQGARHALSTPGADFESIDITFDRIVELHGETRLSLKGLTGEPNLGTFSASVVHGGVVCASARGRMARKESLFD